MRIQFVLLVFFLSSSAVCFAEEEIVMKERLMIPLKKDAGGRQTSFREIRCGEYFLLLPDPPFDPSGPRLSCQMEGLPGEVAKTFIAFLLRDLYEFVTDDSKEVPTAQLVLVGEDIRKVRVRMSEEHLKSLEGCLQ